jgi:zinc protease
MNKLFNRTEHVYSNGLRHIHMEVPYLKTTAVALITRAGSVNEKEPESYGAAHFLEHMLFNGARKWKSEEEAVNFLSKYGVIENAWTYYDMTRYYIIAPNDAIQQVMPVLFDRYFFPTLDPELVEREKGIILEERKMGESENIRNIYTSLREYHYPKNSAYNHRTIGTEESISGMTSEILRKYHDENYSSDHAILMTYGGLSWDKIKTFVEDIITEFDIKPTSHGDIYYPEEEYIVDGRKDALYIPKQIDTNYILLIGDLPKASNKFEFAAYQMFNGISSMGKGSLVEKHLVLDKNIITSGEFEIASFFDRAKYYELFATSEKDVDMVVNEISSVKNMSLNPSHEEYERAKGYVLGKQLRTIESTLDFAYGGSFEVDVRTLYPGHENVTFEDFRQAIIDMSRDEYSEFMQQLFADLSTSKAILGSSAS